MLLGYLTQGAQSPFAYGAFTLFGRPFQALRLSAGFVTPRGAGVPLQQGPTTPTAQRTPPLTRNGFGLLRFRSPLLTESLETPKSRKTFWGPPCCFLFLQVLRCFTSLRSPPWAMYSPMDDRGSPLPGFPIRASPDHSLLAAPRGLSQLATPFIASWHQGIHRVPWVA